MQREMLVYKDEQNAENKYLDIPLKQECRLLQTQDLCKFSFEENCKL